MVPHEVLACEEELDGVHWLGEELVDRVRTSWWACEIRAECDGVVGIGHVELGEEGLDRCLGAFEFREWLRLVE